MRMQVSLSIPYSRRLAVLVQLSLRLFIIETIMGVADFGMLLKN